MYKIYTKNLGVCLRHALFPTGFVRITTVLIVVLFNALSTTTFAQKLDYVKNRISIAQLFKEIKKQTGYRVTWNEAKLDGDKLIAANFKDSPIPEVMRVVLSGTDLEYSVVNKTIVIKDKPAQKRPANSSKQIEITGRVLDTAGVPLSGANVTIDHTSFGTVTDEQGNFRLMSDVSEGVLMVKYVGYETGEIAFKCGTTEPLAITLKIAAGLLSEVAVVSTGYQTLPKERATGSFAKIDEKQLQRNVGTNILDRLEGIASGLSFNRGINVSNTPKFSIHGRSTLFSNAQPLVVLNGFPFEGSIENMNPADIESITLLKDAAAASIWGTRSGNGVIVINTKSGKRNQAMNIAASATSSITARPDLFYRSHMSSAETLELEETLFNKGFYNNRFSNAFDMISGGVEIFDQRRKGLISSEDSSAAIDALAEIDSRNLMSKSMYRASVHQQQQVNISGGANQYRYYLSGGYDHLKEQKVSDSYGRWSLNSNMSYDLIPKKLELSSELSLSESIKLSNPTNYIPYSPYDKISDGNGNPLAVNLQPGGLRKSYVDTVGKGSLLDWHYYPVAELKPYQSSNVAQNRIKLGLNYTFLNGLSLAASYQYLNESNKTQGDRNTDYYFTRNLINQFSSPGSTGLTRIIPVGSILQTNQRTIKSNIFRTQLNFNRDFPENHTISALAGYEAIDNRINSNSQTYYGHSKDNLTNGNAGIDPQKYYPFYYGFASAQIQTAPLQQQYTDITQSYYTNIAYSYLNKYTFAGSARQDESNLFGVKTNQKKLPLWSAGLGWKLSEESFYSLKWLPELKIRLTYGSNGNVDKTVSAYMTAQLSGANNLMGNPYAIIINPPNPGLRWEKVKTWNLGADFSASGNRLTGSFDFYRKNAVDLIGNNPIAPQSGILQFRGNGAELITKGADLVLHTQNLRGKLQWNSDVLWNYNLDRVSKYLLKQSSNVNIVNGNYQNPLEGYSYYGIFSFPFDGLDAEGAARGYLNGAPSTDYTAITGSLDPSQLRYHGTAAPKHFGSLMNTITYGNFQLSVNLIYKFDYYFRRTDVFSGGNYGTAAALNYQVADYSKRWQKPGDEASTHIPAFFYPGNFLRDAFFQYSEALVERGDHIRLQDLRFSYQLPGEVAKRLSLKSLSIFCYAKNIAILWRSNKLGIDPDYGTSAVPTGLSGSVGLNVNF